MMRRFGDVFRLSSRHGAAIAALSAAIWVFLLTAAVSIDAATAASRRAPSGNSRKTSMKGPKTEKKEPIHVTSDRMEAYNKKNMIVFIGKVLAVQGEMQIQSDRLEVYVKKKEKTAGGKRALLLPGLKKLPPGLRPALPDRVPLIA